MTTVVLMTILTAFAATPVPVILIRPTVFPTAMFRTARPVWIVTATKRLKSSPTPATDLWTAEAWDRKPAQTPVSPAPPPCMTTASPALTWEFMTAVPVHTPAPLRIVPTNITRRDANQDMSGMQTTKPAPATHRFTNMPVPAPTKKAADRPATANINPAPVPTAKPGTAKNASAIQVTNTPATAPTKAPAEPAATENTNLVTVAEHMIGTEAHAAVRLLTGILVPEPMKPAVKEPAATGGTNNVHVHRQWNGDMIHGNIKLCVHVPVLINTAAAEPARKAGELAVTICIHIVIVSTNIIHGIKDLNPVNVLHPANVIVSVTVQPTVQTVNLLLTMMLDVLKLLITAAAENARNGEHQN